VAVSAANPTVDEDPIFVAAGRASKTTLTRPDIVAAPMPMVGFASPGVRFTSLEVNLTPGDPCDRERTKTRTPTIQIIAAYKWPLP
jgi:hypothetical protein